MCRAQHIILLRKNKQKSTLLDNAETDPWKLMNRVNNNTNEMLTLIIISASTILSCATLLVASLKIQIRKATPFYTKLMLPVGMGTVQLKPVQPRFETEPIRFGLHGLNRGLIEPQLNRNLNLSLTAVLRLVTQSNPVNIIILNVSLILKHSHVLFLKIFFHKTTSSNNEGNNNAALSPTTSVCSVINNHITDDNINNSIQIHDIALVPSSLSSLPSLSSSSSSSSSSSLSSSSIIQILNNIINNNSRTTSKWMNTL